MLRREESLTAKGLAQSDVDLSDSTVRGRPRPCGHLRRSHHAWVGFLPMLQGSSHRSPITQGYPFVGQGKLPHSTEGKTRELSASRER